MTSKPTTQNSKLKTQNLRRASDAFVLALYVIIAAVMTWPLLADLSGHILRGRVDEYMYLWGFWWMKYSLGTLHAWPFFTPMLYYPFGTELAFHTWSPLLGVLSIPIQNIWGTEVAFNLAIYASYVFSAFSMYLLVDYLVKDKRAAFVGGLVFAFSTFRFYQTTGHIHIISTEFFPIYLLFFIKLLREADHRRRHAIFAGISLGLIFLIDYYQTVYALFFSLCYLIYYLFGRPQNPSPTGGGRERVESLQHSALRTLAIAIEQPLPHIPRKRLLAGRRIADRRVLLTTAGLFLILGLVFIVIGSPLLIADFIAIKNGYYVKWPGEDQYFADALAFFVPTNPIFSGWQAGSADWWSSMTAWHSHPALATNLVQQAIGSFFNGTEAMVFIGWLTLLLIIGGAVRYWRNSDYRFWLVFAIICFLFALGPTPHFAGNTIKLPGDPSFWNALPFINQDADHNPLMPGPYALWAAIPFLNNARVPSRFDMLFTLAAGVMVAYALRDVFAIIQRRLTSLALNPPSPRRILRPAVVTTLLLFVISFATLFENFVMPYLADGGHQLDEPRAAYAQIAAEPNDYAVLNLPQYSPVDPEFNYEHTMYDQTMHHHPVLFAGISRPLLIYKPYYIRERYINLLTQTAATLQPMQDNVNIALGDPLLMEFYRQEGARLLYYLNIGYIVVHPPALSSNAMQFINSTLPLEQMYPAGPPVGNTVVYRVRRDQLPALAQTDTVQMGADSSGVFRMDGFDRPAKDSSGNYVGYTWMTDTVATILTPVRTPADVTINLNLRPRVPAGGAQTLSFYVNDASNPAASVTLTSTDWQNVVITIPAAYWQTDLNQLTIHASYLADPTPTTSPLAVAFKTITFSSK